ncbi:signal recognition particle receptor subunit alpha isoform X2 [Pygocentrus nattereri]|uniref:SRP54-type proteins GTP-binding domain-containing protein n=1 Tax=Pygocentrus nattereri TaxID=42514 RepID=A0A3B4DY66_PYGNA|nr:signal recognition particle receptor subunit alpha isoform X2 [Pygocentrus nattereri]
MLDFFAIFSKGGIVLWCFQGAGVSESFAGPVNALIRSVILQERTGNSSFTHNALSLKYKLDNEFELVFVVGFQKILTLTYVDKFIDDVQLHFRDRYKNELGQKGALKFLVNHFEFEDDFSRLLREAEGGSIARPQKPMRTYNESQKSQKTVKSMIETKGGDKGKEQTGKKNKQAKKAEAGGGEQAKSNSQSISKKAVENGNQSPSQEEIIQRREVFIRRQTTGRAEKTNKSPKPQKPKKKENRVWEMGGTSSKDLDYSETNSNGSYSSQGQDNEAPAEPQIQVDSMKGDLRDVDYDSSEEVDEEEEEVEERVVAANINRKGGRKGFGGMFGMLKGLVGSKTLTQQDMEPILEKMKDHLIAVASTVKQALQESLVQILQPKRRVDILRDVLEARAQRKPFVITFCGVNGVGKSTNLAKISYWLIENGFTVLIAACDTFRAGAVEQLRTHQRRLNSLHPPEQHGGHPVVQLFEKGYGKDAAGIAMEAIAYARNQCFDVVLVDTAGRMQDNAPLMTALAKLIAVNTPDLVLFVGEALVGNEAVDQLVKFNQALADHSMSDHPRLIDGIVLTKFDTIDDKVGAAISMTYITGQPIVFVGTGQTYSDLRSLNARAVVNALMKA